VEKIFAVYIKQLKKWNRAWKLELIETMNPEWNDLFSEICSWNGFPRTRE
jgi:hypothetical protein